MNDISDGDYRIMYAITELCRDKHIPHELRENAIEALRKVLRMGNMRECPKCQGSGLVVRK